MAEPSTNQNILIFSVALNGYHVLYRHNIISHQRYADTHGYTYCCIKKPLLTILGMECAWLKVALMIRALRNGYDWVVFLDADTQIRTGTPEVTSLYRKNKSFYVTKGYSNRMNSGVLIVKNCCHVINYFENALAHAEMPLPVEDNVGWGENGHLIHFAKDLCCLQYIDRRWNNNVDPYLSDYIRHYSHGPLRALCRHDFTDKICYWSHHYRLAVYKRVLWVWQRLRRRKTEALTIQLYRLVNRVVINYPLFAIHRQRCGMLDNDSKNISGLNSE